MIHNTTKNDIEVTLNTNKSENCLTNKESNNKILVKSNKKKIGVYLMSSNQNKDWTIKLKTKII